MMTSSTYICGSLISILCYVPISENLLNMSPLIQCAPQVSFSDSLFFTVHLWKSTKAYYLKENLYTCSFSFNLSIESLYTVLKNILIPQLKLLVQTVKIQHFLLGSIAFNMPLELQKNNLKFKAVLRHIQKNISVEAVFPPICLLRPSTQQYVLNIF